MRLRRALQGLAVRMSPLSVVAGLALLVAAAFRVDDVAGMVALAIAMILIGMEGRRR